MTSQVENADVSPASPGGAAINACRDTGTTDRPAVRVCSRWQFGVAVVPNLIVTFRYIETDEVVVLEGRAARVCVDVLFICIRFEISFALSCYSVLVSVRRQRQRLFTVIFGSGYGQK